MTTLDKGRAVYTALKELDQQTLVLCRKLGTQFRISPDERISLAETILMLQNDRKAIVQEVMEQAIMAKLQK